LLREVEMVMDTGLLLEDVVAALDAADFSVQDDHVIDPEEGKDMRIIAALPNNPPAWLDRNLHETKIWLFGKSDEEDKYNYVQFMSIVADGNVAADRVYLWNSYPLNPAMAVMESEGLPRVMLYQSDRFPTIERFPAELTYWHYALQRAVRYVSGDDGAAMFNNIMDDHG
jgi:hypothetical protein